MKFSELEEMTRTMVLKEFKQKLKWAEENEQRTRIKRS